MVSVYGVLRMRKFVFAVLLVAATAFAQIPAPQIPLTGNLGCAGFPCVNSGTLIMGADANRTMTAQESSAFYIKVTSSVPLTATRNLISPAGNFPFTIENATTGGQSIQIIGPTGAGITIPNGGTLVTWNDGSQYVGAGNGVFLPLSGGTLTGPLTGTSASFQSFGSLADESASPWASPLTQASGAPVNIFGLGDSIMAGNGPTNILYGWFNLFANDLSEAYPAYTSDYRKAGGVFCDLGGAPNCFWTLTGSWTNVNGAIYQTSGSTTFWSLRKQTGASNTACIAGNYVSSADTVTLYFYQNTDSAAFTVTVAGSTVGTYGTSSGSLLPATPVTITLTPSFTNANIVCVVPPASGSVYLFGALITTGTTGVRVWNMAYPGLSSIAFANDTSWMGWIPSNSAAIVALGQNDGWANPPTTLTTNLGTITTALAATGATIAGMITEPPSTQNTSMDSSANAVAAWYQSLSYPVVNIWREWGSYTNANALGLYADTIHPSGTAGINGGGSGGSLDIKMRAENVLLPGIGALTANENTGAILTLRPNTTRVVQGIAPIWELSWPSVGSFSIQLLGNGTTTISASGLLTLPTLASLTTSGTVTASGLDVTTSGAASATIETTTTSGQTATLHLKSGTSGSIADDTLMNGTSGALTLQTPSGWGTGDPITLKPATVTALTAYNSGDVGIHGAADCSSSLCVTGGVVATTLNVASARKGTFTCTSGGSITVTNANGSSTSDIIITTKTPGGTQSYPPNVTAPPNGTQFVVGCASLDTTVYNYDILN